MKRWFSPILLSVGVLVAAGTTASASHPPATPRLVVLISIDQFRADYLERFHDLFLSPQTDGRVGGFRFLTERGANYVDAHHDHLPLATGPGHSILMTGSPPYKSGIVGNDWYDRTKRKSVYCVQDEESPLVGATAKGGGVSPRNLLVTTVGDEMKMATGGQAKVFGISLKDRAAVLMAGHLADGAYWFDDQTGNWISSRFYRKDGTLPGWINDLNAQHVPQSYFDKTWTPSVPASALQRVFARSGKNASAPAVFGTEFPHPLNGGLKSPGAASNRAFTTTPYANEFVLNSAERLIREEKLGQDDTPDALVINLASNDYIGHAFGPNSAEVLDVTVQTDRMLSHFFNDLDRIVPGGLSRVTITLTADHGAAPNGVEAQEAGMPAGRWSGSAALKAVDAALDVAFGADDWAAKYSEPGLWLDPAALRRKGISREKAEDVAATALEAVDGIYAAYPRHRILSGELPRTDIAHHVTLGFHPELSGDVIIVSKPFWLAGGAKGTSHGEPYTYDTHVPIVMEGAGVRPGTYTGRVSTLDIAPTLSFLLRVQQPSGCEGRILPSAVRKD